jgi:hypothetical protein
VPHGQAWYIPGMSDVRKKLLWAWIAALLIGLPVLYASSFGPACWIVSRVPFLSQRLLVVYRPLDRAAWDLPDFAGESLDWYGGLFLSEEKILWIGCGNKNGDYSPGPHMTHIGGVGSGISGATVGIGAPSAGVPIPEPHALENTFGPDPPAPAIAPPSE